MKVGDLLYFSPNFRFIDLKWSNKENLISAFEDRMLGFYLKPAKEMAQNKHGFACGLLCAAAIDSIARIATGKQEVGERMADWIKVNIKEFDKPDPKDPRRTLADRFYAEFRNGLVHEARIKNLGQFSNETEEMILLEKDVLLINPQLLLAEVEKSIKVYLRKLSTDHDTFKKFKRTLERDFKDEARRARRL